jgi:hypothetical protein
MRYELTEWAAIKPMLLNKPRGVPRVNAAVVAPALFWSKNDRLAFNWLHLQFPSSQSLRGKSQRSPSTPGRPPPSGD